MIKQYILKQVVIKALQWTGDNEYEFKQFLIYPNCILFVDKALKILIIDTINGIEKLFNGYYLIYSNYEYFSCSEESFLKYYEEN